MVNLVDVGWVPGPQAPELQNALDALKSESQRCFCGFAKALELLRYLGLGILVFSTVCCWKRRNFIAVE